MTTSILPFQHSNKASIHLLNCYDTCLTPLHKWNHSLCSKTWLFSLSLWSRTPSQVFLDTHLDSLWYSYPHQDPFNTITQSLLIDFASHWAHSQSDQLFGKIACHNTGHPVHQGNTKKWLPQICNFNIKTRSTYIFWTVMTHVWLHFISGIIHFAAKPDNIAQCTVSCAPR